MAIPKAGVSVDNKNPAGPNSPNQWQGREDGRKAGGIYPHQNMTVTQSGHSFILDDSKGAETITLQHRGGTNIQFLADGGLQITTHNGQYNIVFGENRMEITGTKDTRVHGGVTDRFEQNYDATVVGNHNTTVGKNMNVGVIGNHNTVSTGDITKNAQNIAIKADKSQQIEATDGQLTLTGKTTAQLTAKSGSVGIVAKQQVDISSETETLMKASEFGIKTVGGAQIAMIGNKIYFNSGNAKDVDTDSKTDKTEPATEYRDVAADIGDFSYQSGWGNFTPETPTS